MLKDKPRHSKNVKGSLEQKLVQIGQHLILQIERHSKELNKMKDFYRKERTGTRKLYLLQIAYLQGTFQ